MGYLEVKQLQLKLQMTKKNKTSFKKEILKKLGVCPNCGGDLTFDEYRQNTICSNCYIKKAIENFIKEKNNEKT